MNYIDIILVIPVVWGLYKGIKKGLIIELASLIALIFGIYGGIKFSGFVSEHIQNLFNVSSKILPIISFAVTFLIIVILIYSLGKLLEKIVKIVALGIINRIAGGIFGVLKVTLIISFILTFINTINERIHFIDEKTKTNSLLYEPVLSVSSFIIPKLKDGNYFHFFEKEENTENKTEGTII